MSDESPESPGSDETGRKLSIVDAVCCVYFCAAGKSGLLVAILTGLGMEILIPEEVVAEARNKKNYGQLPTHLQRLQASTKVKILPRLVLEDERSAILANVARVRGMSVDLALSSRADLGEAVVIGHARHLADCGHEVYVHRRPGRTGARVRRGLGHHHGGDVAARRGSVGTTTGRQAQEHLREPASIWCRSALLEGRHTQDRLRPVAQGGRKAPDWLIPDSRLVGVSTAVIHLADARASMGAHAFSVFEVPDHDFDELARLEPILLSRPKLEREARLRWSP